MILIKNKKKFSEVGDFVKSNRSGVLSYCNTGKAPKYVISSESVRLYIFNIYEKTFKVLKQIQNEARTNFL